MTGAIEFLRKAKEICEDLQDCTSCPVGGMCSVYLDRMTNEADLVRKVMDYQIKEDKDAENV